MKTTTLLPADQMLARLIAVNPLDHYQERFYPILTAQAGRQLNGMGVVMVVQLAIHDYTEGLPPMMTTLMQFEVEDFCAAIIDDAEVLEDARKMCREVTAKVAGKETPTC